MKNDAARRLNRDQLMEIGRLSSSKDFAHVTVCKKREAYIQYTFTYATFKVI